MHIDTLPGCEIFEVGFSLLPRFTELRFKSEHSIVICVQIHAHFLHTSRTPERFLMAGLATRLVHPVCSIWVFQIRHRIVLACRNRAGSVCSTARVGGGTLLNILTG